MPKVKSRREEYADATRQALVESARSLFAERGFQAVSLDEIAKAARVTKGALYHHFDGKQDLFAAVYQDVCDANMARVMAAVAAGTTPWKRAMAGLSTFLEGCTDPAFRKIALEDGPSAFGWEKYREIDEAHVTGLFTDVLRMLVDEGEIEPLPVEMLARVLHGALVEGAMLIAQAKDRKKAKAEVEKLLLRILEGLRRRR